MCTQCKNRVRSFQNREDGTDGRRKITLPCLFDQMCNHFAVGVRGKMMAAALQPALDFSIVFNNTVMNDRKLPGTVTVGVSIAVIGRAMRCPPGVPNSTGALAGGHTFRLL